MFQRLYGNTNEEQLQYLQWRVILTVICVFALIFAPSLGAVVGLFEIVVFAFVWGFHTIRMLFGFATIGAIFSGNIVLGIIIFLLILMLSIVVGVVAAILGTGRYVYLLIDKAKNKRDNTNV